MFFIHGNLWGYCFSLGLAGNATALGQRPKGLRLFVFINFNMKRSSAPAEAEVKEKPSFGQQLYYCLTQTVL